MLGELIPCGGGDPIPLLKNKLLVGRKDFCDVALPFPNVSSRHCELEFKEGYWFVRDMGSTNGTRVDGKPVEEGYVLPNDELAIATHRFTVKYTPASDRPPPEASKRQETPLESLMSQAGIQDSGSRKISSLAQSPSSVDRSTFGELVPAGGGEPIPLMKPRLEIGRHGQCDIPLRYPTVSARHCELEFRDGYWFVHDMGSRNGVKVDGIKVTSQCVMPGSVLAIAQHRFKIIYKPPADSQPPDADRQAFARGLLERAGLVRKRK